MKLYSFSRCLGLGVVAVLAFGAAACSSGDKPGSKKPPGKDSGAAPGKTDWVTMGYDIESTFHNTAETKLSKDNVASLKAAWADPPKILVYGTPVVVGDTVYVGGADAIYALHAADGSQIWKFSDGSASGGATSSLAYEDGILYFNAGSGGNAVALDVSGDQPSVKWDMPYDTFPGSILGFSSPVVVGDLVVFGDSSLDAKLDPAAGPYRGAVVALHKADGTPAWKTPTASDAEDGCAVWGTVAIDPVAKIAYAPVGNNYNAAGPSSDSIFAYNLTDGTVKWHQQVTQEPYFNLSELTHGPDSDFGANPVVYDIGGKQLVAAGQKSGMVYVWDRLTGGAPLVSTNLLGQLKPGLGSGTTFIGGVFQGLAFDGKHLIVVCNGTTNSNPNPNDEPSNGDSKPPGGLTSVQLTSVLYALDPVTLDTVYARQLPAWVWSPITIANGVGFLGTEMTLEAFDIETGDKLFTYRVPGTIASGITISNGRLFFGSGLSYLAGTADGTFHSLALP
jgi:outer membrane protein assembly factor BamB